MTCGAAPGGRAEFGAGRSSESLWGDPGRCGRRERGSGGPPEGLPALHARESAREGFATSVQDRFKEPKE
jgi:hypothetical protein